MVEIARIRWTTPPPTSVDEELMVGDDATAWLVVRTSRDGSPVIGTWRASVATADLAVLDGQDREVDLRRPSADPVVQVADRIAADARSSPVSTVTFHARVGSGGRAVLVAIGGGVSAAEFELDAGSVLVHLEDGSGTQIAWHQLDRLETGFVSPEPEGLGGVGRPAEIPPGGYGVIALDGPPLREAHAVAIEVSGRLRGALPDELTFEPFTVRTASVPLRP